MTEPTKKSRATEWLSNQSPISSANELYDGLAAELNVSRDTARVYCSNWRKANGVQRSYKKRTITKEIGGE